MESFLPQYTTLMKKNTGLLCEALVSTVQNGKTAAKNYENPFILLRAGKPALQWETQKPQFFTSLKRSFKSDDLITDISEQAEKDFVRGKVLFLLNLLRKKLLWLDTEDK